MKPTLIVMLLSAIIFSACKKKDKNDDPTPTSLVAQKTKKLARTRYLDGYNYVATHPSGDSTKNTDTTYYYTDRETKIDLINDSTVKLGSKEYIFKMHDSINGMLFYVPAVAPPGDDHSIRYFYNKDSLYHKHKDWGVSFENTWVLHS